VLLDTYILLTLWPRKGSRVILSGTPHETLNKRAM
jgi:hypothetical protein